MSIASIAELATEQRSSFTAGGVGEIRGEEVGLAAGLGDLVDRLGAAGRGAAAYASTLSPPDPSTRQRPQAPSSSPRSEKHTDAPRLTTRGDRRGHLIPRLPTSKLHHRRHHPRRRRTPSDLARTRTRNIAAFQAQYRNHGEAGLSTPDSRATRPSPQSRESRRAVRSAFDNCDLSGGRSRPPDRRCDRSALDAVSRIQTLDASGGEL